MAKVDLAIAVTPTTGMKEAAQHPGGEELELAVERPWTSTSFSTAASTPRGLSRAADRWSRSRER